jgi:hypothetical protein
MGFERVDYPGNLGVEALHLIETVANPMEGQRNMHGIREPASYGRQCLMTESPNVRIRELAYRPNADEEHSLRAYARGLPNHPVATWRREQIVIEAQALHDLRIKTVQCLGVLQHEDVGAEGQPVVLNYLNVYSKNLWHAAHRLARPRKRAVAQAGVRARRVCMRLAGLDLLVGIWFGRCPAEILDVRCVERTPVPR